MQAVTQTDTVTTKSGLSPEDIMSLVTTTLDMNKATEIVPIDLKGKTSIADYMVIANGNTQRQVSALADYVIKALKEHDIRDIKVEGRDHADWVLIDAADVIIHLFRPEVRSFYNLDKMWNSEVSEDQEAPLN